jgi:hypothetical protein
MQICVLSREKAIWRSAVQRARTAASKASALAVMETSSARMKTLWHVFGLLLLALTLMSLARAGNIVTITLDPNFPGDYHYYSYTSGGVTYNEPTGPYYYYVKS